MDDLSQFASSNLLHNQERMNRYCPGGYHPVTLGDKFESGRYNVYHKLGFGGFSTVWLAIDQSYVPANGCSEAVLLDERATRMRCADVASSLLGTINGFP
jgi:hypothetical protein